MRYENSIEEEVGRVLEEAKELQDSAAAIINKDFTEEQYLRHRAQSLDSSIRRLRSSIDSLLSSKQLGPNLVEKACSFVPSITQFSFLLFHSLLFVNFELPII